MNKYLLIILILLVLQSCADNIKEEVEYNDQGEVVLKKVYDQKKNLLFTLDYYEGFQDKVKQRTVPQTDFDSVYVYYDNGNILKKGKKTKDGKKFGVWNLYDKNEDLREIREWFLIEDTVRINRAWFLNSEGDTLAWRKEDRIFDQKEFENDTLSFRNSQYNFVKFITPDTIAVSQYYYGYATVGSPLLRDFDWEVLVVVNKPNEEINRDFSNLNEVELDTFFNVSRDATLKVKSDYDPKHIAAFSQKFSTPGEKTIRGYVLEYTDEYLLPGGERTRADRKIYFEKQIYVQEKNQ